jgi:GT2 family glycosyltransferase
MEVNPAAGLCASQVRLQDGGGLDSAGMLICADGSSKQRGHGEPPASFGSLERVLMPSASAALYRRAMIDSIGAFDGDFFLYCEDTDLGLRAARAGWECLYVPAAIVEHRYSFSAGRVSPLKAYYVERNRIFVAVKNFPFTLLLAAPFVSIARYWWHLVSMLRGHGSASRFQQEGHGGWRLGWFVLRAHLAALADAGQLLAKRRQVFSTSRISEKAFTGLLHRFSIPARKLAEL